ncbi:MAG TPA: NfeD family protein [Planctomycetota bacterium]|nr:NfeD family protein [Planctomycetota bacterium]
MIVPIGLLLLGLGLLVAEVFFPSLGALAILSALSVLASVVFAFKEGPEAGWWFLGIAVLLVPATLLFAYRIFPRTPFGRRMIATGPSFAAEEHSASDPRGFGLEGKEGVALSPLRPAGVAMIDGRRVDVVTRGEFLDPGALVRVLEFSGNRVVVASAGDGRAPSPA